jgi:hypothetical protein
VLVAVCLSGRRPVRFVVGVFREKTDSRGFTARLVRLDDGTVECQCPYACLAAHEPCEFSADWHAALAERNAAEREVEALRSRERELIADLRAERVASDLIGLGSRANLERAEAAEGREKELRDALAKIVAIEDSCGEGSFGDYWFGYADALERARALLGVPSTPEPDQRPRGGRVYPQ